MYIEEVAFAGAAEGWFTGRDRTVSRPPVGDAGNLAHRRPHRPADLAEARGRVGHATRTDPAAWHLLQQVHGADVGVVDAATPPGAELRGVDGAVTGESDRPLVVQVADCVPVLLASPTAVGVLHAGRRGVAAGVVAAGIQALERLGVAPADVQAAIGPAIGGCCYEVPRDVQEAVTEVVPDAAATTTWSTPSLDLPGAVAAQVVAAGVRQVQRLGGCTRCDFGQRWFSHRADPGAGRQVGLVVRRDRFAA